MTLSLTQDGTAVTGNGALSGPGGSSALTITGNFHSPNLSVTGTSPGFEPMNYAAVYTKNTLTGRLSGSGFTNDALTLIRNP